MRSLIIEHLDALVSIALGLWLTCYAWPKRVQLRSSPKPLTRALPVMGPLIIGCGVLRILLGLVMDLDQHVRWERVYTSDRVASAEFPFAPIIETTTDSTHGFPVQVSNVKCNLPHRDITLLLSCNEFVPGSTSPTVAQFLAEAKANMQGLGFTVVSSMPDTNGLFPGCRVVAEKDQGQARCVMRVAITPKAIYRALATSTEGQHEDPAINRFVDSFTTTQTAVDSLIHSMFDGQGRTNGASAPR